MSLTVSVLIPTHNRSDQLKRTLQSVADQVVAQPGAVEVIVVANGCTDNTIEYVESIQAGFPFALAVYDEQRLGLPNARNRAVAEAKHKVLAFLDDDVVLQSGYLSALFDVYESHPADMVGGRTDLLWEDVERPDWFPDSLLHLLSCKDHGGEVIELKSQADAIGANFSFRREVFESIGEFRPGLGRSGKLLLGGEEADFLARALRKGFRMFYAPGCYLKHWVAPNRPTPEYLSGVAHGNAMASVFARTEFNWLWVCKASLYHGFHGVKYWVREVFYSLASNKMQATDAYVNRRRQQGYFSGVWLRVIGKSTVSDLAN